MPRRASKAWLAALAALFLPFASPAAANPPPPPAVISPLQVEPEAITVTNYGPNYGPITNYGDSALYSVPFVSASQTPPPSPHWRRRIALFEGRLWRGSRERSFPACPTT
jgi:hypothetical protein